MRLWLLAMPVLGLALGACSSNKDTFAPVEAPEIQNRIAVSGVWSRSVGGTDGFYSQLSPAVSGSTVFAASRDGDVYALSLADGGQIWVTDLGREDENDTKRSARLSGGVALSATQLAVTSENGYLYVLSQSDGRLNWKAYLGNEAVSAPVFTRDGAMVFALDAAGKLLAYNSADGEMLWVSGDSSNGLRLRFQSKPVTVGDNYIAVGQPNGKVQIISRLNGAVVAELRVSRPSGANSLERMSDVSSSPLVLGDKLYSTAYNGGFVEFSFDTNTAGARLDYRSSRDMGFDEDVFVITGDNGHVYCVSRADFHEIWVNTRLTNRNVTAPAVYGNYVVVGDYEGYVYFLNLADGTIDAMIDTDGDSIHAAPLVAGNDVLIFTSGGSLECLRYDPTGLAAAKNASAQSELAASGMHVNLGGGEGDMGIYGSEAMTYEQMMNRRAEARKVVAQIQASERAAAARLAEYKRQKAEYERQRAEYERQKAEYEQERRRRLSGFGLIPGLRADEEEEEGQN